MHIRTRHLLLAGTLGLASFLLAAPARAADEGRAGRIELSDGTVVRGSVSFTRGRKVNLHIKRERKTERIESTDLTALEMIVRTESMERPYTWKNPGDPTKTYGEGYYPLRNLSCRITLRDGRQLEGELLSTVVYVKPTGADAKTRFKIVRQQKGKVGETLDDLVYVKAIHYDADAEPFRPATLHGQAETEAPLEEVVAFHHESKRVYRGTVVEPLGGTFFVRGLPAGTFDLFARTEETFLHPYGPLPTERSDGEEGLVAADREAVQATTDMATDFFEQRHVEALDGTHADAWALLMKDRLGKTSYESVLQGAKVWRLEIWLWHRLETEWRLDKRLYLFRGARQPGEAVRTFRCIETWRGLSLEEGGTLKVAPPARIGGER